MLKKIKQTFIFTLGAFLAFLFKYTGVSAQMQTKYGIAPMPEYGVFEPYSEPTIWDKIMSIVLSPIFLVTITVLALVIGTVIYFKRKKRNAKKDS